MEAKQKSINSRLLKETMGWRIFASLGRFVVLIVVLMASVIFFFASRPMSYSIDVAFPITVPDYAHAIGWKKEFAGSGTWAAFSIEAKNLDAMLDSWMGDDGSACLVESLDDGFMPDFSVLDVAWWHPQETKEYAGAWCTRRYDNSDDSQYYLLLDTTMDETVIVYLEYRSEDYGD